MKIAWLTPFSKHSDISFHSLSILRELAKIAEARQDLSVELFIEPSTHYLVPPVPPTILGEQHDFRYFKNNYDYVVYNIGNNTKNHFHINRLSLACPGVVVVHDMMMQHYWASVLFEQHPNPALYASLLVNTYGARAMPLLRNSHITRPQGFRKYAPWDTDLGADFPLLEPFLGNATKVIVHSTYAQQRIEALGHYDVLKLWLPTDKKPTPSRTSEPMDPVNVTSFGDISPYKNYELLIPAIAQAAQQSEHNFYYCIAGRVGNEGFYERLRKLAAQHLSESFSCVIMRDVSEDVLNTLKSKAHLFANVRYPNTESASGSLAEQIAVGVPTLVYPSGAYADVPDNAVQKAEALTVPAVSDAICKMLEPTRYDELCAGAKSYADAFTAERYATALLADLEAGAPERAATQPANTSDSAYILRKVVNGDGRKLSSTSPLSDIGEAERKFLLGLRASGLMRGFAEKDVEAAIEAVCDLFSLTAMERALAIVEHFDLTEDVGDQSWLRNLHPEVQRAILLFDDYRFEEKHYSNLGVALQDFESKSWYDLSGSFAAEAVRNLEDLASLGLLDHSGLLAFCREMGEIKTADKFLKLLKLPIIEISDAPYTEAELSKSVSVVGGHDVEASGLIWTAQPTAILGFRRPHHPIHVAFSAESKAGSPGFHAMSSGVQIDLSDTGLVSINCAAPEPLDTDLVLIRVECPRAVYAKTPAKLYPLGRTLGVKLSNFAVSSGQAGAHRMGS